MQPLFDALHKSNKHTAPFLKKVLQQQNLLYNAKRLLS